MGRKTYNGRAFLSFIVGPGFESRNHHFFHPPPGIEPGFEPCDPTFSPSPGFEPRLRSFLTFCTGKNVFADFRDFHAPRAEEEMPPVFTVAGTNTESRLRPGRWMPPVRLGPHNIVSIDHTFRLARAAYPQTANQPKTLAHPKHF
jgi:hypothetical protein